MTRPGQTSGGGAGSASSAAEELARKEVSSSGELPVEGGDVELC